MAIYHCYHDFIIIIISCSIYIYSVVALARSLSLTSLFFFLFSIDDLEKSLIYLYVYKLLPLLLY